MHLLVDDELGEVVDSLAHRNGVGAVVGRTIGDCIVLLQGYGEDAGVIV